MEAFETLIERIAPNLYAYRDRFFTSFEATFEMFGKAGLMAFVVGLFFGVLFVALGMALADQNRVEAIRHPFAKAAAAFGLLVVEAFTVRHFHWALDYNMYLMTVPFILYWFAGLLRTRLDWKLDFKTLRESSTVIYFCHAMFLELGEILLGSLYLTNGAVRFCFVFPLTMIMTAIIRKWLPFLK